MKKSILQFFTIVLCGAFISCDNATDKHVPQQKNVSKEVILYNWKEYTSLSTLKEFEAETGIKVILKEFDTQDEQLAKLQSDPNFCDITVFDTHMARKQFLPMKLIKPLNLSKLKNTEKYASHFNDFKETGAPYSFGITGYAVNTSHVKEDFSNYNFLIDPKYKGKISLLDDSVDVYLSIVLGTGNDINKSIGPKSSKAVEAFALKLKSNEVTFNETFTNLDLLVEGEKWIVQTYNGDAASYMEENEFIKFVFPAKNYNAWSEILCLTTNSPNEENAYKLINFLTREKAAAAFSNEFYYSNGIMGSEQFLEEKIKSNPIINVSETVRKNSKFYFKSKESNSETQRIYTLLNSSVLTETE
ncbi:MAG: extracellular solute-binding protein [Lentisphaeraceae bacterium]|nr:extracellular solute-binding protein [Lentisphaeraceae bacterium]